TIWTNRSHFMSCRHPLGVLQLNNALRCMSKMPKKQNTVCGMKTKGNLCGEKDLKIESSSIVTMKKDGSFAINVLAKPGAKQNMITDILPDQLAIQIAAPPVDGEANKELVKYVAKLLDVRKSDVSLDRGSKSRNKILSIKADGLTVEHLTQRFTEHMENG
ncbi:unnamed protein product, partial [Owenia fusiformis]